MSEKAVAMIRDWQNLPVTGPESADTVILVWVISPGVDGFDEIWAREYSLALEIAERVIEDLADETGEEDLLEHGVKVGMKLRRTTVGEYRELQEQND